MNYKLKAFIQNTISKLPSKISYKTYFLIQKKFGMLKNINPYKKLRRGYKIIQIIKKIDEDYKSKRFIEIGAGKAPILPLSLYLHDAKEITTVDLNPYLSHYVWDCSISWISKNRSFLKEEFPLINHEKLDFISEIKIKKNQLKSFLNEIGIKYLAPCDATNLPLEESYFDFHISSTVLEHIPRNILKGIMEESKRILSSSGTLVHGIDYSDHFSHSDKNISPIHFLKFNQKDFKSLASNRYMYMNRMRDDDFQELFDNLKFTTIFKERQIDKELIKLLDIESVDLHPDFSKKDKECIANLHTWFALKYKKI